jgi:outer membrane protein assembly factor BamB
MRSRFLMKIFLFVLILTFLVKQNLYSQNFSELSNGKIKDVEVIIGTFLGNWQRNFYGNQAPSKLHELWKLDLGKGKTVISATIGEKEWAGSGWTGQPLLVREDNRLYLLQSSLDHHLKKIDAHTGKLIWQYKFDDVIKGTGTIWMNKKATTLNESVMILQGSRRGLEKNLASKHVPSFRAISYFSGKELWRLDVKRTASYSRDVDGSALVLSDTAYIGLENSTFVVFSPDLKYTAMKDNMKQPKIYRQIPLFNNRDIQLHGGNLVVESSPALLNNRIYITAGSGHVYAYDLNKHKLTWDFYIGSDLDGSPVVTSDQCILVTVEKQYIEGKGGVIKLDPSKPSDESVVWYFPTENDTLVSWHGGIIGSACVNDRTRVPGQPTICAVTGIDGFLYVLDYTKFDTKKGKIEGPHKQKSYKTPELLFKYKIGPSISTPIIVGNKLIAAGYYGIYLFEFNENRQFSLLQKRLRSAFESTPIVYNKRIYVGSKDGYLYCFGEQ